MDAVEDYARRWIKREVDQNPELESLSDWVRTIRSLVQGRIHKLKNCVNSRPNSVFKDLFKEVMNDLWLARISSLSSEVGLYVVLLEVLLFMPNSLIRHGIINLFDERIVYSPDKDSLCSKRGTTEIL
jgi:hypothetical protein